MSSHPPRPSSNLTGKVAIVTGAGAAGTDLGNGRAVCLLLAEAGASVVCADIDLSSAQRTADMILEDGKGPAGLAISGDVTQDSSCKAVVDAALAKFGRVDILINNVGIIGAKGTAVEADPAEWEKGLQINVTSMMLMAKHAIVAMQRNEPGFGGMRGNIVNVGSVAGLRGGTPSLLYPTAKGAVVNMTRAMASQHGAEGVRVNCVCPGMLYTPMMAGGMSDEVRESRKTRSLLKTEGNAWDCAAAVRFLASDEARWVTGTILTVDAGATCSTAIDM